MNAEFAIIGGTGVYDPALLSDSERVTIDTPFGQAAATIGTYLGKNVAFMSRHGYGHSIPPHKINYRANIWALKQLGVKQVLASAAVGSLRLDYAPSSLVIVNNFLDFTKVRPTTFYEENGVVHVDMTDPYCARLRTALEESAKQLSLPVHATGTYVCAEGPRFESPAEIKMFQQLGGSVVGMTTIPEVVLAKEAELCYATVCMVTNYGAGISKTPLTHEEVVAEMEQNVHTLRELFFTTIENLSTHRGCRCKDAVGSQAPLVGNGIILKSDGGGSH